LQQPERQTISGTVWGGNRAVFVIRHFRSHAFVFLPFSSAV